jgi:L-lactate dehydrogenase complex protein LldF
MSKNRYAHLNEKITEAIIEPTKGDFLNIAMTRGRKQRQDTLDKMPEGDAFRNDVKKRKDICREKAPELLKEFVKNAQKRGTQVMIAKDGAEAIAHTLQIAASINAKTVAKSKSLTTEEIEINHPIEEAGMRVVETDLGELIIQLVHEKPYHLVFPSIHKSAKDVAEIFSNETGKPVPNDIDEIMAVVRKYLRPIFLNTDIGMTGANVGIAETGGIVIETNEGNARLVSSIADTHICVIGMEKIVETIEDAMLMVLAHPVSATGQCPTTYVTWMHGRNPMGEGENQPRVSHMIILDNGRTEMRDDPVMSEALNCIRCGACMNICPTYGVVGGHTFGHIYPGPIGIPWTERVHGLDKAGDFAPLCLSCGLCKEICPAQIDMPNMIAEVKHRDHKKNKIQKIDQAMMDADKYANLGSAFAPMSNWALVNPLFRIVLEKAVGVDKRRALPKFKRNTLKKQFEHRTPHPNLYPKRKVAFFADIYYNNNAPELGLQAVELLEAAGCEVVLPAQEPSGYPYIAYGDLDAARTAAETNLRHLLPWVKKGYDIIGAEPTAVYTLKKSYPYLLKNRPDATKLSDNTFELFDYLLQVEEDINESLLEGKKFGFHCSCHQRPIGSAKNAVTWLEKHGAEIQRIETGTCCGMGGTFGLKCGPLGYDLSMAVGKPLFKLFDEAEIDAIVTESSVCNIQLAEGTKHSVFHPLEIIRRYSK